VVLEQRGHDLLLGDHAGHALHQREQHLEEMHQPIVLRHVDLIKHLL